MLSSTQKKSTKFITTLSLFVISLLATANSFSQEQEGKFFGKDAPGKWIIGAKIANIDPNESQVNDASGIGVVLGYEFYKNINGGKSSFELEYISGDEATFDNGFGTYEANQLNAFLTYRSAGALYFKFKAGISYTDITTFGFAEFEDASFAYGLGLGYKINDYGRIELEFSQDSGDAELGILGLNGLLTF